MNEEVIISIKGLRVTEDTDEDVEVITPGKYYLKNGKHYLLYDEIDEKCDKDNFGICRSYKTRRN